MRCLLTIAMIALPIRSAIAQNPVAAGRALYLNERKGNCVSCHQAPGDPGVKSVATVGPVLEGIRSRFPDRGKLRSLLWDAGMFKTETIMPPYGRHRILTENEIDTLVTYLETL